MTLLSEYGGTVKIQDHLIRQQPYLASSGIELGTETELLSMFGGAGDGKF